MMNKLKSIYTHWMCLEADNEIEVESENEQFDLVLIEERTDATCWLVRF